MKLVNICGQHLNKFASHGMVMLSYFFSCSYETT